MNDQALIKAKRNLYYQLLSKPDQVWTCEELEMLHSLNSDRDIQDHLEKHRQAELSKQTK